MSTRPSFFESDLPCFWIGLSLFWLKLSVFRVRPFHFLGQQDLLFTNQTCRVFELDLPCFDSDFPCLYSDLLIFRVSSSPSQPFSFFESDISTFTGPSFPFFWVSPSDFSSQTFPFFGSVLLILRVRLSHFFGSVLPTFPIQSLKLDPLPIFFTVSFRLLPILCFDLIAMCTVDKIKDVGVCRKHLHCTANSLARETNQQNTNRQARKKKKQTKLKLFLK